MRLTFIFNNFNVMKISRSKHRKTDTQSTDVAARRFRKGDEVMHPEYVRAYGIVCRANSKYAEVEWTGFPPDVPVDGPYAHGVLRPVPESTPKIKFNPCRTLTTGEARDLRESAKKALESKLGLVDVGDLAPASRHKKHGRKNSGERAIVDRLLRENVGPDSARLYRAVVHQLYDELKELSPVAQMNLVTCVVTMLFKVSSASSAYANQDSGTIEANSDVDRAPKRSLVDIMEEKLRSE